MKLLYIANIRFPTERAHGIQIAQMCNAFAGQGVEVELVVQRRVNVLSENVFTYYDLPKSFRITELSTIDTLQYAWSGFMGKASYIIQTVTYAIHVFWYAQGRKELIYSRDETLLYLLSFFFESYAYEIHAPKWNFITKRVVKKAKILFPISRGLKDFYIEQGVAPKKLCVAADAVDIHQFDIQNSRNECRKRLDLPLDKYIVLYAGHLYKRKGAFTVAESAALLSHDTLVALVGGTEYEIPEFIDRFGGDERISILGPKPHRDIPYYLRAADVLVLPNSGKDADASTYTSPMKLFEYMASGTPIVASDVPSLREILDEETAYFFTPDDPISLAQVLGRVALEKNDAATRAVKARERVSAYSWENRAKNILKNLPSVTGEQK